MAHRLMEFVVGLLFGIGLIVAGMTDPAKVQGFLDLAGNWDPSLAFVMGGAILVGIGAFFCGPQAHHRFFGWCHAVAYSTPHRQAPGHWQLDVWRRLGCGRFLPWARHRFGGCWPAQGHRVRHCDGGRHGHF